MTIKISRAKKTTKSKKSSVAETRPDHLFRAVLEAFTAMPGQFERAQAADGVALHTAYHAARRLWLLTTKHRQFLVEQLKSQGDNLQDWIQRGMEPLSRISRVDPFDLIALVANGLTFKEFLAKPRHLQIKDMKRKARQAQIEHPNVPAEPKEPLNYAEQAKRWKARCKAQDVLIRNLKAERVELIAENKILHDIEKQVKKLDNAGV